MAPPVRTEIEVAADTIMALMNAKLLKAGAPREVLSNASIAAKVPMDALSKAYTRLQHRGHVQAPTDRPAGDGDRAALFQDETAGTVAPAAPAAAVTPDAAPAPAAVTAPVDLEPLARELAAAEDLAGYFPEPAEQPAAPHAPKLRPRRPVEEKQLCLSCRKTKGLSKFRVANVETGRHSRSCIPCEDDRSVRSVDVERDASLATVRVSFMVHEGDRIDGVCCPDCSAKVKAGDLVYGHVGLRHEACPGVQAAQRQAAAS